MTLRETEEVPEGVTREWAADVLVVASKRAAGVAGLLLGGTAQALLRASPCPVLIVRPE
jgi:nucleotide-binding universal stress UspA family protein